MALLDALILFAVVWIGLSVAWLVRERRRPPPAARWAPRTLAIQGGGHIVELVCRGEPAQEVRRIPGDLDWDELGTQLAEGMSEAQARAATLNGARGAGPGRLPGAGGPAAPPSAPRRRPR